MDNKAKIRLIKEYFPQIQNDPIMIQHYIDCIEDEIKGSSVKFSDYVKRTKDVESTAKLRIKKLDRAVFLYADSFYDERGHKHRIRNPYRMPCGVNKATKATCSLGTGYLKSSYPDYLNNLELIMTKMYEYLGLNVPSVQVATTKYEGRTVSGVFSKEMPYYMSFRNMYKIAKDNYKSGRMSKKEKGYFESLEKYQPEGKKEFVKGKRLHDPFISFAYLLGCLGTSSSIFQGYISELYRTTITNCVFNQMDMNRENVGMNRITGDLSLIDVAFGYCQNGDPTKEGLGLNSNMNILRYTVDRDEMMQHLMTSEVSYSRINEYVAYLLENKERILKKLDELIDRYGEGKEQVEIYRTMVIRNFKSLEQLYIDKQKGPKK